MRTPFHFFAIRWQQDEAHFAPAGFHHLERFHLEGTIPVRTYVLADARLGKRVRTPCIVSVLQ